MPAGARVEQLDPNPNPNPDPDQVSAETAAATWVEIGGCVARTGVRKLVLYNSHGGNHALAEVVARRLRHKHGMLCVLAMNLSQGITPGSETAQLFPEDEVRSRHTRRGAGGPHPRPFTAPGPRPRCVTASMAERWRPR